MKKYKLVFTLVIVFVMILSYTSTAFAYTLKATSTTSNRIATGLLHTNSSFYCVGGTFSVTGSATKLTLRAYKHQTNDACSNAITHAAGSFSGKRDYWSSATSYVDMKGNTDYSGSAALSGSWYF